MILTVNIGNTNTRICVFQGRKTVQRRIVATQDMVEHPERFLPVKKPLSGAAVASVVPKATNRCLKAIRGRAGLKPFLLDERSKTGLEFRYNRKQLGADRVCDAVGARVKYPGDIIVIDFGTAVTVNIVTEEGVFLGGPILPGQTLMLESLHGTAARLPLVKPEQTTQLFCRTTTDALQAGTYQLLCLGLEAMIKRVEKATARTFTVIATGGGAERMKDHMPSIDRVEPDLASRGLMELFLLNRPEQA